MKIKFLFILILFYLYSSNIFAKDSYFEEAVNLFEEKKYEQSKFLFQKNIVFNPKHSNSYLYLAKIFNIEENESEVLKNINTTLLLNPNNEEALYILIDIKLKRSDFAEVKDLKEKFEIACSKLCDKKISINKRLKDIDTKSDS
mgnify:CR=1 FL=1|tara:strand:+ start:95 stop:526 length:432 start_codon:yes stop_codon:yes gene_type:complete